MIWFTADTHFGHEAILRHCSRPFASIAEMDEFIIDTINQYVKPADTLYHLGDFAWRDVQKYRRRLECRTIKLIMGNHDYRITMANHIRAFQSVEAQAIFKHNRVKYLLNHLSFNEWYSGMNHLFGHHHTRKPPRWQNYHDQFHFSTDVGWDAWLRPINIEELTCLGSILHAKATEDGINRPGALNLEDGYGTLRKCISPPLGT
jgi:calcineurin-like phosphoesterase family protein